MEGEIPTESGPQPTLVYTSHKGVPHVSYLSIKRSTSVYSRLSALLSLRENQDYQDSNSTKAIKMGRGEGREVGCNSSNEMGHDTRNDELIILDGVMIPQYQEFKFG
eukprot:1323221-Ditylum_brightwellii.AAC.1